MKVTINRFGDGPDSLQEFADKHGLELVVDERSMPCSPASRYHASFAGTEIKEGPFLSGAYGDGHTPNEAIQNYAMKLRGKTLVVDAYKPTRCEIKVPNELYYEPQETSCHSESPA
jgi:hypothetical protein